MQTREWRTIDKSAWGDGPWQAEPDKKQWRDAATGLPCLIVRGPHGALCGYVGVAPSHPAHGLHYDGIPSDVAEERSRRWREDMRAWSEAGKPDLMEWHRREGREPMPDDKPVPGIGDAILAIEVHGGLTFADECAPGDDPSRGICHVPDPGEPDHVWWFGFDCAHAGDFAPEIDAVSRKVTPPEEWERRNKVLGLGAPTGWGDIIAYRDLAYVERECASLARQLAALAAPAERGGG